MKLHRDYIKKYKKNSILLILSFSLTIALLVSIFILLHTNYRIEAKQNMFIYSAMDCQIKGLTEKQLNILKEDKQIKHLGISRTHAIMYTANGQHAAIVESNKDEVTTVSKLLKGTMPKQENEVVAEKWTLLNLGIAPEVGAVIKLTDESGKQTEEYKVTGIINDISLNKLAGALVLYTGLKQVAINKNDYAATIKFNDGVKVDQAIKNILKLTHVSSKKVSLNVWKENIKKLTAFDIELGALLICVSGIIIWGIFRIFFTARRNQYGMLRAIGMRHRRLLRMIILELLDLYFISIPIGLLAGGLSAYVVTMLSRDNKLVIYFWGKRDKFQMVIPPIPILVGIVALGCVILLIGCIHSRMLCRESVVSVMEGGPDIGLTRKRIFFIKPTGRILKTYQQLGLKYIFQNIRSSGAIILSISIGCCLFYGLGYQAELYKVKNSADREYNFYNSDYIMTTYDDRTVMDGIKEGTVQSIRKLDDIQRVETQSAMPVKVVDQGEKRNDDYLNTLNQRVKRDYGFSLTGSLKGEKVYLTKLKGYNETALEKLHKYIKSGDFNPHSIKDNEVIVAMPTMSTYGKSKGIVASFKEGKEIFGYKCGDTIKLMYRADYDTSSDKYWACRDDGAQYNFKEYKIAAIVYYPYMKTVSQLEQVYPLLITSDKQMKAVAPNATYESVNVDLKKGTSAHGQEVIEDDLINLAVKNGNVTARSMISENEKLDIIYNKELVYVFGIAVVGLALILINIVNNLKYRVCIRKSEWGIYQAIGIKKRKLIKMICFENVIMGIVSLAIAFPLSYFIAKGLYEYSGLYTYGVSYQYNYFLFIFLTAISLMVSYSISRFVGNSIMKETILDEINIIE